jgi:hypothetical protein
MWYSKLKKKKTLISRHIVNEHWHTCPIALTVYRNQQHRSLFLVASSTSAPPFQPYHQRNVFHPVVKHFTRQTLPNRKQETFLYEHPLQWSLLPMKKNNAQQNAALRYYTQARSPFLLLKPASEHSHAHLLPRLSWTVLLPSDTNRKPITSITAVLLPFVTYLLTLPCMRKMA